MPALESAQFRGCNKTDLSSHGFYHPIVEGRNPLLVDFTRICVKEEKKVIPGAAVKSAVEEKCRDHFELYGQNPSRKQKQAYKDDVIITMAATAFTQSKLIYAYFDKKEKLLIVDASSEKKSSYCYVFA